jgi:hypothetical protein
VSVNEVNYPYDIPNIQAGFNFFTMVNAGPPDYSLRIVVAPGFYSGTELATAINAASLAAGLANTPVIVVGDIPQVTYSVISNQFTFTAPAAPSAPRFGVWSFQSPSTYPLQASLVTQINKDILSIMGYYTAQDPFTFAGNPFVSGSAPLVFTQYIDICSPELCQYQYFRDGSTSNFARRSDVICRLYISNNVATQEEEGQRPFVINRQFNNARVMRWNSGSSVGSFSIQLYDDVGQPLQITYLPRPYQITFNVYEQDRDSTTY